MTAHAWQWLASLLPEIQPKLLAQRFPRIVNKFAELWRRPSVCEKYFDALVLDQRGSRKGFPLAVAKEIATLRAYFNELTPAQPVAVWAEHIRPQFLKET